MKILVKFIIIFYFFLDLSSNAEILNKIKVNGNERISKETIINTIEFKKNKKYSFEDLNIFQKKLFETNFFNDVKLKINSNTLLITVKENPIIDFFYIKGVENKAREDFFYENLSLGSNKIFSDSLLKADIDKIKDNYRSAGYFDIDVKATISKLSNSAVNLVIDVDRKTKFYINRIYFIGKKIYKSSKLSDVILSSEHGWWKFLSTTSTIDTNRIEVDKKLLKKFYLNNGYYDVQILSSDIEFIENNLANVVFSIDAGDKYTFSDFEIKDENKNLTLNDFSKVETILKNKLKGNYSEKVLININDLINDYLKIKKIDFVTFNIETFKRENSKIFTKITVNKSKRAFVNLINVSGNSITEESVIRRNLTFSEGDAFTKYKLDKSIDNLKSSGIFKEVKASVETLNQEELIDLNLTVEEQPTGSIAAGVGVGSAGSTVSGSVNENNLFGKGIKAFANVSLGTEKISGKISVTQPDFKNSGNDLTNSIFAITTDYTNAGYESKVIGTSASLGYETYEDINFTLGLGLDMDTINTKSSASALYKSRQGDYLTLKGFYSLTSDKRNSKFQPTRGHRITFGQSLALPGSNISYIENNITASKYYSLNEDYIFNIKGGFQAINSIDNKDIKLSDRKFLSNSQLRGFESFGVGPKDGKEHVGGNYSSFASFSSTIPNPIPESWNAKSIFFLDAANVWGVDYNESIDSNKIRSSTGFSLEWISPLGPLSFTVSEVLSKASGDLDENFSFQIGSVF